MDTKKMAIIATKGTLDWAYPRSSWPRRRLHWVTKPRFSSPSTASSSSARICLS